VLKDSFLSCLSEGVTALDICPERGILLAGSEDGKVIAWDLNDLEVIQTLVGHTGEGEGVCVRVFLRKGI
jgi:WD40 repeat protein